MSQHPPKRHPGPDALARVSVPMLVDALPLSLGMCELHKALTALSRTDRERIAVPLLDLVARRSDLLTCVRMKPPRQPGGAPRAEVWPSDLFHVLLGALRDGDVGAVLERLWRESHSTPSGSTT